MRNTDKEGWKFSIDPGGFPFMFEVHTNSSVEDNAIWLQYLEELRQKGATVVPNAEGDYIADIEWNGFKGEVMLTIMSELYMRLKRGDLEIYTDTGIEVEFRRVSIRLKKSKQGFLECLSNVVELFGEESEETVNEFEL